MKKLFFILVTMLLPMVASADAVEIDGIYYNLISKGGANIAEVTSKPTGYYSGPIVIPEFVTYQEVKYSVTSIGSYAFSHSGLTSITIPNSVTSIGSFAFSHSGLTSITIPNSVTSIGSGAFMSSSLTSITIPNSVTSIVSTAFYDCSSLTSITIPNSVTSIGNNAFYNCSSLTSITIPNSVTSIGKNTFANCKELADVYCYAVNVPSTGDDVFMDSGIEYATLHVPANSINTYKTTEPWKNFGTIVTLGDTPGLQKCVTPTITYKDGKLSLSCDTEGVEYVTNVECLDNKKFYDNEIQLSGKYRVSVYATKAGYEDSDIATTDIDVRGLKGDINGDDEVNVTDIVTLVNIIMSE